MITLGNGLDERDAAILAERTKARDAVDGPRVGDYVIFPDDYERQVERFSHDWGDSLQTSPGGSWHLGKGYASFSGALNPSIPKANLVNTGETKLGQFWFFHHGYQQAHNGIDVVAPCRVFQYKPS